MCADTHVDHAVWLATSQHWCFLELSIGKRSLLELRDKGFEISLCSFGHFISVPSGAVWVVFLGLGVKLSTVGKVIHGLKCQSWLISREKQRQVNVHKKTEISPHQQQSEFCKAFCIILHDSCAKVTEESSNVLSSFVISLNHILHLVGEQVAYLRNIIDEASSSWKSWDMES